MYTKQSGPMSWLDHSVTVVTVSIRTLLHTEKPLPSSQWEIHLAGLDIWWTARFFFQVPDTAWKVKCHHCVFLRLKANGLWTRSRSDSTFLKGGSGFSFLHWNLFFLLLWLYSTILSIAIKLYFIKVPSHYVRVLLFLICRRFVQTNRPARKKNPQYEMWSNIF